MTLVDEITRHAVDLLEQAVTRVSFVRSAINTAISLEADGFHVHLCTRHRDTNEEICIDLRWDFPRRLSSFDDAVDWIYSCVREAWVHELNEALFVDGTRRRDLHDEQGRTVMPPDEKPFMELR